MNLSKYFYDGKKVASCTTLYNWANTKGYTVNKSQIKRGDFIIFEFVTKGEISRHIGMCESFDGTYVTTIDGNTCEVGKEWNGMEVMRRKRHINTIKWVIRLPLGEEKDSPTYYVVKRGDYISKIAKEYNMTVQEIMNLNPQISNPNLIYVGQQIRVK